MTFDKDEIIIVPGRSTLRFRFRTKDLEELYTSLKGASRYAPEVVDAFFEVVESIRAARDERDIHSLRGLRYERLHRSAGRERSLRLNRQWRLIVEPEEDEQGKYLLIAAIEDYH